jgi:hypothetical protein
VNIIQLRTHVDLRNGRGGINKFFSEAEGYKITLKERVFTILLGEKLVTCTPIENCIEFIPEVNNGEEISTKKARVSTKAG